MHPKCLSEDPEFSYLAQPRRRIEVGNIGLAWKEVEAFSDSGEGIPFVFDEAKQVRIASPVRTFQKNQKPKSADAALKAPCPVPRILDLGGIPNQLALALPTARNGCKSPALVLEGTVQETKEGRFFLLPAATESE